MSNYHEMTQRIRAADRSQLTDAYRNARDLETRQLAERVVRQAGRNASSEFLREVADAILQAAAKQGAR